MLFTRFFNSFNVGPAHIIAFSSEFYYYLNYGYKQVIEQYEWLIQDLEVKFKVF